MRILRVFGLFVLVAALACGYLLYRIATPYQGFQNAVYVDLPHGTTTDAIAVMLTKAGVVRSRFDFSWRA